MMMKAQLALASDAPDGLSFADRAVTSAKRVKGNDSAADSFALAKAYRLLGEVKRSVGDRTGASAAWASALAAVPAGRTDRPAEMREHALILQRLGRRAEAMQLSARLESIGFRKVG